MKQRLAEWTETEPADDRLVRPTPPAGSNVTRNEVPERPSAAYLRNLILALIRDETRSIEIERQCIKLMRAINSNDLPQITQLVAQLGRLADDEGRTLPRLDAESSSDR